MTAMRAKSTALLVTILATIGCGERHDGSVNHNALLAGYERGAIRAEQGQVIATSLDHRHVTSQLAETPPTRQTPSPADQESHDVAEVASKRRDISRQITSLSSVNVEEKKELFVLKAINQKLCERLHRLRTECGASVRLMPDGSEKILACIGNTEEGAKTTQNFSVVVRGAGSSEFKLIADTYESTPFREGTSELTWKTEFNTDIHSPRLMDIISLKLKSLSGPVPLLANFDFELLVNGQKVVTKSEILTPENGDPTFFQVRTLHFLTLRRSDTCRVSAAEIAQIKEQAKASAEQTSATSATKETGMTP